MKALRGLLPLALLAVCSCRPDLLNAANTASTNSLVEGNTRFACDLYARLKTSPGNLFFSPYSISTCLAMAYAGARGSTEAQMAQVLHFPGGTLQSSFAGLQAQLQNAQKQKGIELDIANGLWSQQDHPFLPEFLNVARQEYGATLNMVDFGRRAESATREINNWVAQKTRNKIQNIIAPGAINGSTRLVLANAIYFKGAWAVPFQKSATRPQLFHLSAGHRVNAPFMTHVDTVKYFENGDLQGVGLPYAGEELSMLILLPREADGCSRLENSLQPPLLETWLTQMQKQKVQLIIPRFKLESGFSLQGVLANMGMPEAFSAKADFSGIDGARDLFISSVAHKAWVDVNEEGTEAAAATTAIMAATAFHKPPPPPPVFRADHPFLFLIRDTRSGSILFLGRLAEPGS